MTTINMSAEDYRKFYEKLSPEVRAGLPLPEEFTPQKPSGEVRVAGNRVIYPQEVSAVPTWVKRMIKARQFWGIMAVMTFFFAVWYKSGEVKVAAGVLMAVGAIALVMYMRHKDSLTMGGSVKVRPHHYEEEDDDEDDDDDGNDRHHNQHRSHRERVRDLYVPRVNSGFYFPRGRAF